ncbi:MAG TPA: protein kinase [Vicinamibacterales bacterium]|nr:protein kinase [Vicinamibacterales bacterium]
MSLTPGTRLGAYDVIGSLGSGAMGEVYRARDTKLRRDVAIKVLPALFAGDPDRLARFEREAQTLASLNHPHVAQVYGVIEDPPALVMELIEGRPLSALIRSEGLPLREALPLAIQTADALAAAHAGGIVHRDFKPANVVVTDGGVAKVLDFGVAKSIAPTAATQATATAPQTDAGLVLGTVAYMSPEQAAGRPVDARSDVFSFGSVLFEMTTGQRAFEADTSMSTLAAIIHQPARRLSDVNPALPRELERLIAHCHRKDPASRLQSMVDVRSALEDLRDDLDAGRLSASTAMHALHAAPRRRMAWTGLALVGAAALVAIGLVAGKAWWSRAPAALVPMRLDLVTPPTADRYSFALSPEGQRIVYAAQDHGRSVLWLRTLTTGDTRPLAGTARGYLPFWSPDGRSIGFFIDSRLYRLDVDAGAPQSLTPAPLGTGGSWNRDGIILFSSLGKSLQQVAATGGVASPVNGIAPRHAGHFAPSFLPDGRHFLYYVRGDPSVRGIYVGSLDKEPSRRLFDADPGASFAPPGDIVFVRDRTLFSVPFDMTRRVAGERPVPLARDVMSEQPVAASDTGVVAFRSGESAARSSPGGFEIARYDRSGHESPVRFVGQSPSLSSDGGRLAAQRLGEGNVDIWLFDLDRSVATRATFDPADDVMVVWAPDATQIVFSSNRSAAQDLYIERLADGGVRRLIASAHDKLATDWSRDGQWILYTAVDPVTGLDIAAIAPDGKSEPVPVARTPFDEKDGQFSPDGRWVAYQSNETGAPEVWIRPFRRPGAPQRVSVDGGTQPRWRADGRELFFVALDGRLMSVAVTTDGQGALDVASPLPLFQFSAPDSVPERAQYDVEPDGKHFIGLKYSPESSGRADSILHLLLNWTAVTAPHE